MARIDTTMKAYKGFNRHEDGTLWCHDFKYEVGKTYKFKGKPILCEQGFHACHQPHQCWVFYPNNGKNVYYEVEYGGKIVESNNNYGDDKFVCTEIKLIKEIATPENKFDYCYHFCDGYAMVAWNDKCDYIDTKGKLLSKQWFDDCWSFYNGYAVVKVDGKYNHINTDGKYISDQWWDWCSVFREGYARVNLNDEWNYITTDG